ncbi:MAG: sensor histidine kinase, partial [Gemmatimonadota bacterium]
DAAAAVDAVVRQLPTAMLTIFWKYAVMLGIFYAFDYREKYRERELRAVQLEARLTDARLNALEMQLHPHFLFNTLHSIAMLNLEDPDDANRMLTRLSELLRTALEHVGAQEITLAEELEFVGRYLEIERLRFRDRLIVTYDIDPALLSAHVPNLVLQPLVENAVRHGVANRTDGGRIDVSARSEGARIVLEVRDDGGGLPPSWRLERDGGIGLTNTRDRLAGLYGDMGGLDLTNEAGGGATARVWLPLRIRDGDDPSDPPAAAAAVPSFAEPDRTGRDASEPGIDR